MNWLLIQNSLLVSISATLMATAFGFFAALCCASLEAHARKVFFAAAIIVLVLPPFLVTNCWIELFGEVGTWRRWLPLNIYSLGGAAWILALLNWPITMFFVFAALRRVEAAQLEVDPLLRGFALVRWLLWPMARTAFVQAAVLTLVLALNNFAVPAILQVKVFPAEIWVNFNTTFDNRAALRLCWPMIVGPLLLVLWFGRKEIFWQWRAEALSAKTFRQQLGKNLFVISAAISIFVLLFSLALPLWQLVSSAKTWQQLWPALAAGQSALLHSIFFAAATASVVVGAAMLSCRAGARTAMLLCRKGPTCSCDEEPPLPVPLLRSERRRGWQQAGRGGSSTILQPRVGNKNGFDRATAMSALLWLPFFVPGVLLGIALIWIFNRPGLSAIYQSAAIVILAYTIRYAALGWTSVARAAQTTDRNLNDVAKMEGATAWQIFRHVQWPQIFPTVAVAWYVTYLLCLWDVETLVLIVPPGGETLALRVFNLLHYGHNAQVNAICLLLLFVAIAPAAVAAMAKGRWKIANAPWLVVMAGLWIFCGCSDSGKNSENRFLVKSQFFSHVQIIGKRGAGLGEFNKPRSVALDREDNLFVVDMTGRVQKFSSNGVFLASWQMPQTDKGKPKGMCTDRDGNIVLIEPHYSRVNHFSPDGKLVAQWGVDGTNFGQLAFPRGVAVNSRGEIYVSEYEKTDRVQRFTKHGEKCLAEIGLAGSGDGEFSRAEGIGVDGKDQLYVADSCNHRVQIFSADGKFLRTYGKAGSGTGELSYPYDVRVDENGFQFVCEFGNSRIQIFDAQDRSVEILGGAGGEPGQFSNPWSIALDSQGNLYVADSQNHRVQKFIRKIQSSANGARPSGRIALAITDVREKSHDLISQGPKRPEGRAPSL